MLAILFFITNSCLDSPKTLNIMTYNIRLDVEDDGVNQWDNRKKGLVSLIKEENPDILGIQEGLPNQIEYLLEQLDEYSMIGEGRNGGNNGEYSAIYYKNKKLRLEKDETFWLSETPGKPSIGWDAALNRIATVGVFIVMKSNKKLIVYNSHFDHIGKVAREKSVNVILNHIKGNNYLKNAIVVMGDFNAIPTDAPIKSLLKNLDDSFNEFAIEKPFGTFNGFELNSKLTNRIDYIFTKNLDVYEYKHIYRKLPNGFWPSDHLPIFVSINE
jgi:endonuclease/exonuclease/phosphatase family metal-dependent hydrolase